MGEGHLDKSGNQVTIIPSPLPPPRLRQRKMAELSREVTSMSAQRSQDQTRHESQDMGLHQAKTTWDLRYGHWRQRSLGSYPGSACSLAGQPQDDDLASLSTESLTQELGRPIGF